MKFILVISMGEREIFGYFVNLTVTLFKEDVEKCITHMKIFMQLSNPPFNKENKEDNDASSNKTLEDEVGSSRRF